MDSIFCKKDKFLRKCIIFGTVCTVILLSVRLQDDIRAKLMPTNIVHNDNIQSTIQFGEANTESVPDVNWMQLKWEEALSILQDKSHKKLNDSDAKQKIVSILDITKDDYESLFYKVDIEVEFQRSIVGNPLEPLSSIHSPCWISHSGVGYPNGQARTTTMMDQMVTERHQDEVSLCLRCLPIVYLIGISKCGTTDLRTTIRQHPLIEGSVNEKVYWNRQRIGRLRLGAPHFEPFHEYIDSYNKTSQKLLELSKKSDEQVPHLILDATPHYLWDYDGWQDIPGNEGLDEPRFILPHTLVKLVPNAKYIAILRNPTSRLYSQFHMISPKGSPELFQELCEDAIGRWNACTARYTERACAYNGSLIPYEYKHEKGGITLRASMYYIFLKDWFEVLPRENVFVIRGEDYYANRTATLKQMLSFLDLPDGPPDIYNNVANMTVKNASKNKKRSSAPMLPETREMLNEFYKPFRNNLAKLLNNPKFAWND